MHHQKPSNFFVFAQVAHFYLRVAYHKLTYIVTPEFFAFFMTKVEIYLQLAGRKICISLLLASMMLPMIYCSAWANGNTSRVNVDSQGKQSQTNSFSKVVPGAISADGRYTVFNSYSNNLVASDTNNASDVFVHDRQTKKTVRISVNSAGRQGNSDSGTAVISADGRFVAFESRASNLVSHDTNNRWDVFIHDRNTHKTERVSIDSHGNQGSGESFDYHQLAISADGRFVAFISISAALVAEDTNQKPDVFVHDRASKQTTRISVDSAGKQANGSSSHPAISADGRFLTFYSDATNLTPSNIQSTDGVFIHDRTTHTTKFVGYGDLSTITADGRYVAISSLNLVGQSSIYDTKSNKISLTLPSAYYPAISADGQTVAYTTFDHQLDPVQQATVVYDLKKKITSLVSINSAGINANDFSYEAAVSADGRFAVFASNASNLVSQDTNNATDIFVRDRMLDTTHHADLKVIATQKPGLLKSNSKGNYIFTITNIGPDAVADVGLLHLISGANTLSIKSSQGHCKLSTAESVCHFGKLAAGKNLIFNVTIKAFSQNFNQQITVTGAPVDTVMINNHIALSTRVK